jgi:glycosyltransferase involved in cell wall biosynthesis
MAAASTRSRASSNGDSPTPPQVPAAMDHADSMSRPNSGSAGGVRIRVAVVTNIPAPYRVPVFNLLAKERDIDLHVFYAARREPDREWDLPEISHPHSFLRERFFTGKRTFIHNNPDVFAALRTFDPQVVVTTGFSPTYLYAFVYTKLFGRRHVVMTDGTLASEAGQSRVHRLLRRVVLGRSSAFVVASDGGRALLREYGVAEEKIHFSPLCANTSVSWASVTPCSPGLDFLFSGRLVHIKNPLFALQVAHGVANRLGRRVSLGILGGGPLAAELQTQAAKVAGQVELRFAGHVTQADVPAWFASARVFLFPTSWDPWGVVANEACLAGVPIIVSPHAGAAGELICDGINGYIRPLELSQWIEVAANLISDAELHSQLAAQAHVRVKPYTFENAARGIAEASRLAFDQA